MCGIVGYIGTQPAVVRLLNGLRELDYRGDDSASVAFRATLDALHGAYAILLISETAPDRIFFALKGSPLQLSFAEDGCHFASSDAPLVGVCSQTLYLEDGHWGVATAEGLTLFAADGSPAVVQPKPLPASSLAARRAAEDIPRLVMAIGRRYVQTINKTYRRTGTLWDNPYKSSLIQTDTYLLRCQRYIELHPVRADTVRDPGEYAWSSCRANGLGACDPLLSPHSLYLELGGSPASRQGAYCESAVRAHRQRAVLASDRADDGPAARGPPTRATASGAG